MHLEFIPYHCQFTLSAPCNCFTGNNQPPSSNELAVLNQKMSHSRKRGTKSKKKPDEVAYSELKTIPEQRLQQQHQQEIARLEATPIPRRMGSQIPTSNLLSQMTQMSQATDQADLDDEEMDRIFISQEEQRRFKALLQLYRKGKINAGNAFDVPLNVLPRDQMSTSSMQLWRVASEMLNVSTNIYDKRVQNVFQETSKVNTNIVRNQQQQEKDKPKAQGNQENALSNLIMKGLQHFERGMLKTIDVGQQTLEEPDKINGSPDEQFAIDPLFQKTRTMFDSSSARGLLLNSFEVGPTFQIQLLSDQKVIPTVQSVKGAVGQSFMRTLQSIQPQDCEIFNLFTSTQDKLCKQFELLGVDKEDMDSHAIHKIQEQEVLRFGEELSKIQELQPQAHSQPVPDIVHSDRFQAQGDEFLSSQGPMSVPDATQIRNHIDSLHQFEELSERDIMIGTGSSQILSNFQTPWDIPNPFSKRKRAPSKRKQPNEANKNKNKIKQKDLDIFFNEEIELKRDILKAVKRSKRTKSPSKMQLQINGQLMIPKTFDDNSVQLSSLFLKPITKKTRKDAIMESQSTNQVMVEHPTQFTFNVQGPKSYEPVFIRQEIQNESRPLQTIQMNQIIKINPLNSTAHFASDSPQKKPTTTISMKRYKTVLYMDIADQHRKKLTDIKPIQSISIQTTFVALLHLANEKNLSFLGNQKGDDFQIVKNSREKMQSQ